MKPTDITAPASPETIARLLLMGWKQQEQKLQGKKEIVWRDPYDGILVTESIAVQSVYWRANRHRTQPSSFADVLRSESHSCTLCWLRLKDCRKAQGDT